jgi:hypothetical protein
MNPDITLNFKDATEASLSLFKLSNLKVLGEYPLFFVEQLENQLFLKETLPEEIWFLAGEAWIENTTTEEIVPLFDFVEISQLKNQHTAHDVGTGWALFYGNTTPIQSSIENVSVLNITEICPLLQSYFEI